MSTCQTYRKKVYVQIEAGVTPTVIACNIGIARSMVYNIKKLFQETGDFVQHTTGSSRPRTTRTKAMVASVRAKIEENPRNNVRKITKELEVDKSAVSHVVRANLGLKSHAVAKVQLLTAVQQRKRLRRCKLILNQLKIGKDKVLISLLRKSLLWTVLATPGVQDTSPESLKMFPRHQIHGK